MSTHLRGIGMTSQRTRERLIERLRAEGIRNEAVLEVIRMLPRHLFVDEALASRAYEDSALPIGLGQTISQPYIVARMTELLLGGGAPRKVLEIGTGCGYQAAVLGKLVAEVYSMERITAFMTATRTRLRSLGLYNVHIKHGDGSLGWPEQAPFDGIVLTAAPAEIPRALLEQLAVGGRLVAPLGSRAGQVLTVIDRSAEGYRQAEYELVSFVPLLGGVS
jgi:protein-L-isoaspartate(D-aspartate) O-methyltransferase